MPDELRIHQILEELCADATPEEMCGGDLELLFEVRRRWERMRRIGNQLDDLFPANAATKREATTPRPVTEFPRIEGYELESVIGRGGMGIIFKAKQHKLNRVVALKMMASGPYAGPTEVARFRREIEAVAALRHPHIVQIHDVSELAGSHYFTMEFVEGGTLAKKLQGKPQADRDAAELIATLACAVQFAHKSGFIHRDLKPANILLTPDGMPKIADFGLARSIEAGPELTMSGARVGTPSYMAPEQAQGKAHAIGPAVDVYALGAILYEMLTGRPPFDAETSAATMQKVIHDDPIRPSQINPKAPRDLETICLKCLRKLPAQRYSSAQDLADDLGRFLRDEPVLARPVGVAERVRKWVSRHQAAAVFIAAVVLLLLVGGVSAGLQYQRWAAGRDHQAKTDRELRGLLDQTRGSLNDAWRAQDLAQLTAAVAEGNRAVNVARSGDASAAMQQEAEAFRLDADERLDRAKKNHVLRHALLDGVSPLELSASDAGRGMALRPLDLEGQYTRAFRAWGVDTDVMAETAVADRLRTEPDIVVQELIAALDRWMIDRQQGHSKKDWRRLFRIVDQIDRNDRRRRLRALLIGALPLRAEWIAAQIGLGSPWLSLWEMAYGNTWKHLMALQKEIELRKEPALTAVMLAEAFAALGDKATAEALLRQAVTTRPGEVVLLDALGKLLESHGPSRLEEAIGYYRAARSQRPSMGINLSNALIAAGRAAQAEEVILELMQLQPDNAVLHFYLGRSVYHQKKYRRAESSFRKAIDLNVPDPSAAYVNLGVALNDQGKYAEAEGVLRKVPAIDPSGHVAAINLGTALNAQKKYREAESILRLVTTSRPDDADAHAALGTTYSHQKKHAEAETELRTAVGLKPNFPAAWNNLGSALAALGKRREAEAAFRKAIEIDPTFALAHYHVGIRLIERQNYAEAETAFRKAIDLDLGQEVGRAHFGLGFALMKQSRFDAAAASMKNAGDAFSLLSSERSGARQYEQECKRFVTLDARLSTILDGTDQPKNAAEHVEFANLCRNKQLYAASTRFAAAAFALDPKLADATKVDRYNAACAAALAGCNEGKDAKDLDLQQRARLRRQALDWLRADLAYWTMNPKRTAPNGRSVSQWMQHWKSDSDFVGIRDQAGLARLPSEEREQWAQLWAEVDALLQRVRYPP